MRRTSIILVVLVLATSCPRKSVELRLDAPAADGDDPRALAVSLVQRLTRRHDFVPWDRADELHCIEAWHRRLDSQSPAYDAFVCSVYSREGPIVIRIYDVVTRNKHWSAPTDSLRRELVDSLGRVGHLTVREQ